LAANTLLNIATAIVTSVLAVAFVPLILHRFGTEFYGILSVTWMVLANFNFLDFGFSRASARYVAQELAQGNPDRAAIWTWTAVLSQAFLGVVGAVVIYHLAPFIVDHIHVQRGNRELGLLALRLFACSIPIDFANRSLTGVMQAGQRFDWVNGLSILNTLSTYCAYGIGILRGNDFATVVTALFAFKIVNLLATYYGATKVLPRLLSLSHLRGLTDSYWPRAVALVRYGWWVAAAALVAPMLVQFDSWMISFLLGVSLLPFFTVPTGLLWRLGFLPSSLSTPLFPAFSAMEARTEWGRIENYFVRAHRYLLVLLIPVLLVLFIWGEELLRLWVGAPFARQAALPLRLLIPGFLIGLVAPLSGTLLEAVGRPDILVKLYLAELPLNVVSVWLLTKYLGVPGAALSYTVRTIVETVALWLIVYRLVPFPGSGFFKRGVLMAAASALVFLPAALGIRATRVTSFADLAATVGTLLIYAIYAYRFVFDARDRQFTAAFVRSKARSFAEKCGIRRPVLDTDGRALDCGPVE